jgi:hypothetical protein
MAESLRDLLDSIMKKRGLRQKPVIAAIGIGAGTFALWRKDPGSASDATIKKIRDFTEHPDRYLSGSMTNEKPKGRPGPKPKNSGVSTEALAAFAVMDQGDLTFVGQVAKIMGIPAVSLDQVHALIALRKEEASRK